MVEIARENQCRLIAGDWNMAMFNVPDELGKRGMPTAFLGSHLWKIPAGGSANRAKDQCRFDSLGLFVVTPITRIERLFHVRDILADGDKLEELPEQIGAGHAHKCYLGGLNKIVECYQHEAADFNGEVVEGAELEPALPVRQKPLKTGTK